MLKKMIKISLTLLICVVVNWLLMQPSQASTTTLPSVSPQEVDEVFVQVKPSDSDEVNFVAFSPDGKTALSGSYGTVKWWNLSRGRVLKTLKEHVDDVNFVALSPDGKTALSNSNDTVKWWDLSTGRVLKAYGHFSNTNNKSVAFSPDGKTALSGFYDTVILWDLSTGRVLKTLKGHTSSINSVAFSPDGKTALSGSKDNTVKWWDLSPVKWWDYLKLKYLWTGRVIKTLEGHSDSVNSVAFSPDGKTALSGSEDNTMKLWNLSTGRVIKTLKQHSNWVNSVAFSPNGQTALLSYFEDKMVKTWDLSTGRIIKIKTLEGHFSLEEDSSVVKLKSVAFSPDGKTALSGSEDKTDKTDKMDKMDKTVKWWDLSTGRILKTLKGHSNMINSLAFSPDGQTALSGSDDKTVKLWNLSTVKWWSYLWWDFLLRGRVIKTLKGHTSSVNSVAFSPNGKEALSGSDDNTVKWWDLSKGGLNKTLEGHSKRVNSVAFSPDGQTALSGSDDKTVKLWKLSTGDVLKTLKGHSKNVKSVAFSPDGQTALSGSKGTVKLWNLLTGSVVKTLKEHPSLLKPFSSVKSVAFSPDGQTVLSGSEDKTVKWWDLSTGRVLKILEGHKSAVNSVAFSPDGQIALSGSKDTIRLWNLEKDEEIIQEEIIQMVGFKDGESVAIMPKQGYYVASPNGEQYINVRVGKQVAGIEKYDNHKSFYHRPDILQLALQIGEAERAITLANQEKTQIAQKTRETQPKKRTALIIGNAAYQDDVPLINPVNDATDLAAVLRNLHFEVIEKHNLNYAEMGEAILEFDEKLRQNPGVGLFYFSGHGVQYQGTNYLIPVDGADLLKNPKQLRYKTVAANYIQTTMESAGNRVNLFILDACRRAPTFIKNLFKDEMILPGLSPMKTTSGSLIAYVASPGRIAMVGRGRNSLYVVSLMNWMQKPHMSINKVLRKVRKEVVNNTGGKQSPGYYDELNENFSFYSR